MSFVNVALDSENTENKYWVQMVLIFQKVKSITEIGKIL